jgi:hypothetical protein
LEWILENKVFYITWKEWYKMNIKKICIIYVLFSVILAFVILQEDISVHDTVVLSQEPDNTVEPVIEDEAEEIEPTEANKDVNWNNIYIPLSEYWGEDWGGTIVHDSEYYFYFSNNKIIRLNIKSNIKTEISNFNSTKKSKIILYLSEKQLYYINQSTNDIYSVNYKGNKKKKILDQEVIKEYNGAMKNPTILGMNIYNEEVYLMLSAYEVVHYDIKQKKLDNIAYDVRNGCFLNNSFYYMKRSPSPIYRTGLETNTDDLFNKSTRCKSLFSYKDKLYYNIDRKIFECPTNKEYSMFFKLSESQEFIEFVPSEYMFSFVYWEKDNLYLSWKKSKEKNWNKIMLPDDFYAAYGIIDGLFFYEAVDLKDDEEEVLPFYKVMYILE